MERNSELTPMTSFELLVPKRTAKLLYFSDKDPQDISSGLLGGIHITLFEDHIETKELSPDEPSMIFVKLPVIKPNDPSVIPRPGYYPSYARLTREQRWVYLNWLKDISKPINIGYVFLYYYGLERHLLIGEFDLAVDEILYLRKYHDNNSFIHYSNSALLNSCLFRKRPDRLKDIRSLLDADEFNNIHLLLAYHLGYELMAKNLLAISRHIKGINRRYIDKEPGLFESVLEEGLVSRYGEKHFPFSSRYNVKDLPKEGHLLFANTSLPEGVRTPKMPDFLSHEPFIEEVASLFKQAHEKVKLRLREKRKKSKKKKGAFLL
jgi:hypothetical protein